MEYKKYDNIIYLRLDKNDEVLTSLTNVCKKENINTASVSGIGGCGEIEVGTFVLEKQDYCLHHQTGMFEMVSLTGNITLKDGEPFAHMHSLFSYIDENGNPKLVGGHLKKAIINLTGEIVITQSGCIKREKDDSLGIYTWKFI